ncbi:MAG TPA: transaldolase [Thermoanaerobaculia bacterium]|jgi:transaldolase/glucose-6-phosphate isomerase|nr:transaldolase [Thermoanaerobaculia bacterium]
MSAAVEYRKRGQAVWLDTISQKLISSGRLGGFIDSGAIYGVTSNPTIFGQAIQKNEGDYNDRISALANDGKGAFEIYDALTRQDIAEGADLFRTLHGADPVDGWISLEVLPSLAAEAEKTVAEAIRLNKALARPNVFIKVPSTPAGVKAIRELIGNGISINVTLMFNRKHYADVATAYIDGLSDFAKKNGDLSKVHSVASFFVSRVDTLIDEKLDKLAETASGAAKEKLLALRGKAGLANCKVVYQDFLEIFAKEPFKSLAAKGARVQRPLWASTGTKNPAYSDLLYVENLIGKDTVNTMPEKTLDALLDHGKCPGDTVLQGVDEAKKTLAELKEHGIDVEEVGETLQEKGVVLFSKSYDELLSTIEERRASVTQSFARTRKIPTVV